MPSSLKWVNSADLPGELFKTDVLTYLKPLAHRGSSVTDDFCKPVSLEEGRRLPGASSSHHRMHWVMHWEFQRKKPWFMLSRALVLAGS